jgi:hypothetical protein
LLVLNGSRCDGGQVFDITCFTCQQRYLVGTRSIRAFRNTDDGPVAIVRCPSGHLLEHEFRARTAQAAVGDAGAPEREALDLPLVAGSH